MAHIHQQQIPAELLHKWMPTLTIAKTIRGKQYTLRRTKFKIPSSQIVGKNIPDWTYYIKGQKGKRIRAKTTFAASARCFNKQPPVGGVVPPNRGYRARTWWFDEAIGTGLWYYCYFIQQTINWFNTYKEAPPWCDCGNPDVFMWDSYDQTLNYNMAYQELYYVYIPEYGLQERGVLIRTMPRGRVLNILLTDIYSSDGKEYDVDIKFYKDEAIFEVDLPDVYPCYDNSPREALSFWSVRRRCGYAYDWDWLTVDLGDMRGVIICIEPAEYVPEGIQVSARVLTTAEEAPPQWPFFSP